MAEALPRYCPRCGTPTRADMRFCATCELPVEAMLSRPDNRQYSTGDYADDAQQGAAVPTPRHMQQGDATSFAPLSPNSQDFQAGWNAPGGPANSPQFPPISPLPPRSGDWNAPNSAGGQQPWSAQPDPWSAPAQQSAPEQPWNAAGSAYPPNNPATQAPWGNQAQSPLPQKQTPRPPHKLRAGRVFLVLFIILLLAGGGVFAYSALGGHLPGLNASQATIKTTALNGTVTYAGATITLLSVQQAQNFIDDPQTASDGMLRLNLQEQNSTNVPISWDYTQSARLVGQGKAALTPTYVKSKNSIAPGATQKSVIDFAVANGGNLSTLVFQLGTAKEAQMQIPLSGQANLSQYQPKTTTQKGTLTYFGLDWTLTSSTTALSIAGQQASSGMEFLTLNLTVDNTLSQQAISGSPFDYMRVKAGGQTATPVDTTMPVSFASGDMGKKGTATFLIPQNSTTCTLLMLSQDPGGGTQAKLDFQIG
jgi:hypothetical protein